MKLFHFHGFPPAPKESHEVWAARMAAGAARDRAFAEIKAAARRAAQGR